MLQKCVFYDITALHEHVYIKYYVMKNVDVMKNVYLKRSVMFA